MAVAAAAAAAALAVSGPAPAASSAGITGLTVIPAQALAAGLTQFTISGSAPLFAGDSELTSVTATLSGVAVTPASPVQIAGNDDETAFFTGTFDTGGALACGANTVAVTLVYTPEQIDAPQAQRAVKLDASEADGTVTITAFCPVISVSPGAVGTQQLPASWTVTPSGFPPLGDGESLTVDGAPVTFTTDGGGDLEFTASPSCGAHTVTLSQPFTQQTAGERSLVRIATASASLTVLCPQISLTPPSVPLASEPAPVQVTGTEFHPDQPVTITLDGKPAGSTTTGPGGGFSVPITAGGLACGPHQVTATEQPTAGSASVLFSESAVLQVTNCTLKLTVSPVVVPGQAAHVTGTGFAPGQPVTVTWQRAGGGGPLQGTLKLTAGAGGAISGWLLVVPLDGLGSRQAVATQGKLRLTAATLVTPWPAQPAPGGQLVDRG